MAAKLKKLRLDRIDFVDRGANPDAHITLCKRDTPEEKVMPEEVLETGADELAKRLEAVEADKATLAKRAEEAEQRIAKMEDENAKRDAIAKAGAWANLGKAEDVGGLLYEVRKAAPAIAAKLETQFTAWQEQLAKGALFAEVGKDAGEGDTPTGKLEALAKSLAAASNITFEQAYAATMKTVEGKALYAQMRGEK